jgi:hypothetical protein
MQEISDFLRAATWDKPTIAWKLNAQDGDTIEVESVTSMQETYKSTVTQPVNDGVDDNAPLLDYNPKAVKHPMGCVDGGVATSNYLQGTTGITPTKTRDFPNATVTWTRLVNATLAGHFRTFCVVFDIPSQKFCALRQADWSLNVRSNGPPAGQHAIVHADAAASADPAVPPPRDKTADKDIKPVAVGPNKTKFQFKKKK